ncbi:hypothetical protein CPB84DRAFT_1793418 [Gymnopilus junonius]|uniref:Uncharacterized protein n=1 Tax=Gymnopilus junonius TaxID=109634 RepID=A0A9P5NCG8_GYMJU|nr:hypothetical protein CPB84DRAFT_1793418 [Gymnopilus junonius]
MATIWEGGRERQWFWFPYGTGVYYLLSDLVRSVHTWIKALWVVNVILGTLPLFTPWYLHPGFRANQLLALTP